LRERPNSAPVFPDYSASSLDRRVDEGKDSLIFVKVPMQAFLSILMASVIVLHAAFGCCWHHAHCCSQFSQVAVSQPAKCCQHHHESSGSHRQSPGKCKVECHGVCNYLVPQKVRIDPPRMVALFDVVANQTASSDFRFDVPSGWTLEKSSLETAPLRLHLLHQHLLI
jgi:hypothetical protein